MAASAPSFAGAGGIAGPDNLTMTLDASGVGRQDGSTRTTISGMALSVSYQSQFMILLPADVVAAETPSQGGA